MILVNDKQVDFTKFPDGTTSFRCNPFGSMTRVFNITWKYRSEEHTSELQSRFDLVCRLLLEKKKK